MVQQTPTETEHAGQKADKLPADIAYLRALIVNIVFVGQPGSGDWVLVDAGIATYDDNIAAFAAERLGPHPPRAIVLTHGHFDHVGTLHKLLERWNVPVYAHEKELPYLTGKADYPAGDPSVGGGLMARVSPLYPHKGIDLGGHVHPLPNDGTIPAMPEWRWVATPGHTPGHVSLFRERDRALIAGDAFITVKQESAFAVMTQEKEIHGPPAYFTPDWDEARESVRRLEALRPATAITGHGVPIAEKELADGLAALARDFDRLAVPELGKYV
jgi:glyoxylase-like metal-dependent hydrolase (beta-lactamase superfamily II)